MTVPADLRPSASGTLAKTPLAHLIVFVAEKKLDGTLVLREPSGNESIVAFAQGAPGRVKTSFPSAPLGRVLTQLGLVDHDTVERAAAQVSTTGEPIGQYLLSLGKVDQAQLVAALREQVMRRMIRLFEQVPDDTAYAFYASVNLLEGWGGPALTPIDPFRVLWEGINAKPNDPRIEPTLTRLSNAPVRMHPTADLQRFGFGPPELMLIDLLRAVPMSIDDLVERAVLPVRQTKMLAYCLLITKSLTVAATPSMAPAGAESPRAPSPSSSDDAPPSSRRGEIPQGVPMARVKLRPAVTPAVSSRGATVRPAQDEGALREEMKSRAATVDKEDFFTVLGVTEDAPSDVIRSAYFALAKKWHPDRLPASMEDVRDDAAKVFARISEAHATLTDGQRRQKYLEMRASGGNDAEQAQVQRALDAAFDFQKAEVFAKKRDFEKAEKLVIRAMEGDPEQSDYIALYAWILANRPDRMAGKDFQESLLLLNTAIAKEPRCERGRFYRATLLKMLGRDQQAIADFREAAALNPRNIDAIREVRLWEMRGSRAGQPESSPPAATTDRPLDWKNAGVGEIFGRLFKKK